MTIRELGDNGGAASRALRFFTNFPKQVLRCAQHDNTYIVQLQEPTPMA